MALRRDTLALTVVLALLTSVGPLSTDMYLPSLPAIARHFAATAAEAQLTLSIFLVGFAAGQAVYGPLSDVIGRRPVLLAGLALFVLGGLACALAPSIAFLNGARFLQALGGAAPVVLGRAMVRDLYEGPRAGQELARMGTIMGLVPALAPILGGVLHQAFGWRANFWAPVAFGIVLAAVVASILPETSPRRAGRLTPAAMIGGFGALLLSGHFRRYVALTSLAYAGLFSFISGSSFVLQNVFGLSEIAFAFSFAGPVLGYIFGTIAAQRLVPRRGMEAVIGLGSLCLAAGGLAMLGLVASGLPSSLAVTAPMALYTFGVGLVMPQAVASAMAPYPDKAGAASSLLGIVQMSFAALVGIALGHALGASALPLPIAVAATGLLAAAIFATGRRAATP